MLTLKHFRCFKLSKHVSHVQKAVRIHNSSGYTVLVQGNILAADAGIPATVFARVASKRYVASCWPSLTCATGATLELPVANRQTSLPQRCIASGWHRSRGAEPSWDIGAEVFFLHTANVMLLTSTNYNDLILWLGSGYVWVVISHFEGQNDRKSEQPKLQSRLFWAEMQDVQKRNCGKPSSAFANL